uniref:Uncharacterized protein n=1 Tax=Arundo donax TaxID=35708 RepID=A0A0A9B698_ARUDO
MGSCCAWVASGGVAHGDSDGGTNEGAADAAAEAMIEAAISSNFFFRNCWMSSSCFVMSPMSKLAEDTGARSLLESDTNCHIRDRR